MRGGYDMGIRGFVKARSGYCVFRNDAETQVRES